MAQHLPIQTSIIVSQNSTRKQRSTASPPGSTHTSPGENAPDRLAVFPPARRQRSPRPHCFLVTAWRSTPCRQAPLSAAHSPVKSIAWRLSAYRQAPYQNNIFWFMTLQLIQFTVLNPFHRSHKNPNLNPHISKPTNIICKQIHVLLPLSIHSLKFSFISQNRRHRITTPSILGAAIISNILSSHP